MKYVIQAPEEVSATLRMPVSKSQVAREAVIRALCGATPIPAADAEACDDTRVICRGVEGPATDGRIIDVGLSATAFRLLTAYHASCPGHDVIITGKPRLLQRPMQGLIDALRSLGADIEVLRDDGSLHIRGCQLTGGPVELDADVSSQYITALMLVGPYMQQPLQLHLLGAGVSEGYWRMTAAIMQRYGVEPDIEALNITVPVTPYDPSTPWRAEGDWSCATYWYELEAFTMGDIALEGLDLTSPQPDRATVKVWEALGILSPVDDGHIELEPSPEQWARLTGDFSSMPDAVPSVVVTCLCLGIPLHLWGLQHLQYKESNRLQSLYGECLKLGVALDINPQHGTVTWDGARQPVQLDPMSTDGPAMSEASPLRDVEGALTVNPHGDHRMAMAFAPVAWYVPALVMEDAECVSKSYPAFWQHLQQAGFTLTELP